MKEQQSFDKIRIVLEIKNPTYDDKLSCSLLENGVIKDCRRCNLKKICEGIEEVAKDYYDGTTKVVGAFNFYTS
ncbi:hypothetical protein [Clostridium intestinale]|uniref:Uncharacterized protein n=1 Tax=Clostridium intestinale URNW TaxID=1294142 RepID=U2N2I5_9CLOT|nr:hypothetical protein [Clostridium intestinale]ERK29722.1 hypothetical protein CINTURNW_2814 [Clostridium intestinale URNW]